MALTKVVPKVICLLVACLTLTLASTREEIAEDIIERVLGIPNSDKVLNSVLGRLEKNRQGLIEKAKSTINDDTDCDDTKEVLPEYTEYVDDSRDREMRHIEPKHDWICESNRTTHRLSNKEYEYRPAYYEEIRCLVDSDDEGEYKHQFCSSFGLSCVQWNKTIHVTRRRYTSDCWETKTMVIPAGCECMWPQHKYGPISDYFQRPRYHL